MQKYPTASEIRRSRLPTVDAEAPVLGDEPAAALEKLHGFKGLENGRGMREVCHDEI